MKHRQYDLMDFDRCVELQHIRKLCKEHEDNVINGGALHIVTEDGNYEDDCVQECIDYIESGEYKKRCDQSMDYDEEGERKQLILAKELIKLTEFERSCVIDGNTVSEEAFNRLYNEDSELVGRMRSIEIAHDVGDIDEQDALHEMYEVLKEYK